MKHPPAGSTRLSVRRQLLRQIAAGVAGGLSGVLQHALAAEPAAIHEGIRRVRGTVLVDGRLARVATLVPPGATVITEGLSEAAYVVGQNAYLQRADTHVVVGRGAAPLRIITGALMSVFGRGAPQTIRTPVLTAGIRGTGCYIKLEERRTYFCLCYGAVDLMPDGGKPRSYTTKHHDSPFWISPGGSVTPAGQLAHEDDELALLESLVGRELPFALPYKR